MATGAFADGVHFPFLVVAIQLRHDHGGMWTLAAEVVARDFPLVGAVDQPAEGALNLIETLATEAVDGKDQVADGGGDPFQIDEDLLVVALALARTVVPVCWMEPSLLRSC